MTPIATIRCLGSRPDSDVVSGCRRSIHLDWEIFDLLLWPKNECSVQRAEWSRVDTAASIGNRQLLIFEGEIVCFNTGVQRDVTCWGLSAIFDSELNANAWFGEEAFGQHSNIGAKLNLLSMFGRVYQIAG